MVYNLEKDGKVHQVEVFDSVQNLPILRFQKNNKYLMISSEIGNSLQDYDKRMGKALEFIRKGMTDEAIQELQNQRMTVFNAFNEFTPTGRAFAVLVKRIDDVHYPNYTPDDLDRCLKHLDEIGFDYAMTVEKLSEVKKN